GVVRLGWYSTDRVAVAKLTEASTTPSVDFAMLSTLAAQDAQVMFSTGKDCLIEFLAAVDVAIAYVFIVPYKGGNLIRASRCGILGLFCKIYTLSSGFRLSSLIFLKWLGVSPVTFLN